MIFIMSQSQLGILVSPHIYEVVFALPLRDDGKIWSGKVSFTASKLIEVEILHIYSALVFHKTSGKPFTVTYTIDAVAKNMTR